MHGLYEEIIAESARHFFALKVHIHVDHALRRLDPGETMGVGIVRAHQQANLLVVLGNLIDRHNGELLFFLFQHDLHLVAFLANCGAPFPTFCSLYKIL